MMDSATEPLEIWVRIEKDEDGYPQSQDWEELWAWPLEGGNVRIESIPFFAEGISPGDVFATARADEGFTTLDHLVERSGHSTFRIWLREEYANDSDQSSAICKSWVQELS